ncbi:hypothetical protein SAMN05216327_109157 [Dyadobacter sp. SG02]|uniref:hypothetical protein n=1 Tax=Dyadobacter sp. SG02 TaxID=1855291 RepID=UPI0008D811F0|nr:hypothetical protein [Dyadobacter sp. SG02]SEJ38355.1 hypothetical protein SAMN05216327_109157 [Dyadobacter sp. SG02]
MKKILIQALVLFIGHQAIAQKDAAISALAKHNLDASALDEKLRVKPTDYSYDLKETVATEGSEKVILGHYDASKPEEDRWTVISSDDQEPSTTEIKRFKKEHGKQPYPPAKIDDSSYKVEKDEPGTLVISFKLDPASLVADNSFIKDCRSYLTIDTKTGKIIKAESVNEKPLKVKTFNVPVLNSYSELTWNETEKKYFPKKDNINMTIKLLGQEVATTTILEYSNFKK